MPVKVDNKAVYDCIKEKLESVSEIIRLNLLNGFGKTEKKDVPDFYLKLWEKSEDYFLNANNMSDFDKFLRERAVKSVSDIEVVKGMADKLQCIDGKSREEYIRGVCSSSRDMQTEKIFIYMSRFFRCRKQEEEWYLTDKEASGGVSTGYSR